MSVSIKVAPPNSLIVITDRGGGSVPDPMSITRDTSILYTESCIIVPCLPFIDGETEITLGTAQRVDPGRQAVFDGLLPTPTRSVVVSTVESENLLEEKVPSSKTRLRIWTNHPRWTSRHLQFKILFFSQDSWFLKKRSSRYYN